MIFSSREPSYEVVRWDGVVIERGLDRETAEDTLIFHTGSTMREQPQHNPTNPILAEVRRRIDLGAEPRGQYQVFLNSFAFGDTDPHWSVEEINHARKVLTRLANFVQEE